MQKEQKAKLGKAERSSLPLANPKQA
jgi:hypothetical protein